MSAYGEYEYDDYDRPISGRQVALIDLLDRLLSGGVVLTGDLVLSIADIDLVRVSLRAVIVAVREEMDKQWASALPEPAHDAQAGQWAPALPERTYAEGGGHGDDTATPA
ncbi:gas vesicle protein [Streptomyces sp. DSM 40750]|uniref:gas vesicle protein n=1 Tax=Streptomyces sp. DSM 40750 TaxID=2801030 RepID=UPI00214C9504|nr:gas vesicle protein [Streptomyces sp. DSM 40750]UUU24218.1 gas vesicle protein [Streptomyces sp. DSM 40750]